MIPDILKTAHHKLENTMDIIFLGGHRIETLIGIHDQKREVKQMGVSDSQYLRLQSR